MRAIGVDVGGTTTKIGVCAPDGTLTHGRQVPTPRGVEPLVALVTDEVSRLRAGLDPVDRSSAVAVVVPGIVDERTGTAALSVNLGWRDVPLRALLTEALGTRVVLGHDVRAGALAECRVGAGCGLDDILFVPLGTGIAGALVLDGKPLTGRPWAGEIGQLLVTDPGGGAPVPLERLASASAVERRYLDRRSAAHSSLANGSEPGPGVPTASGGSLMVFERARAGDQVAGVIIGEAVAALAEVLAAAVALLGPLRIVVGGGMAAAGDDLLGPLRTAVAERLGLDQRPEIVPTACGTWAGCIGAGLMALDAQLGRS